MMAIARPEFMHPERLWLLIVVALFAAAYVAVLRWRRAATVRFTQVDLLDRIVPRRPAWRRHVVAGVQLLGLAGGVVAIAQPFTTSLERTESEGRIVVLFDVSASMSATDVAPDRLAAAQQAATTFVDQVDADIEVGLVMFSARVTVASPPTLDRAAVNQAIANAQLDSGTAIGDAVNDGVQLLLSAQATNSDAPTDGSEPPPPGAIVLLSDGDTTAGRSTDTGAQLAADAGIPVFTIAFGTPDGSILNPNGGRIATPVNPEALQAVAERTGGQAYEAATADQLAEAYSLIEEGLGATLGNAVETVEEQTWIWAAGALAALALAWALSLWWLRGMV